MELLHPPFSTRRLLLPRASFSAPKFSFKTITSRNRFKFHIPSSEPNRSSSISFCSPLSTGTKVRASSSFGRPTSRRNSLRKKLLDDPQVRKKNPISLIPDPNVQSDYIDSVKENDLIESDSRTESKQLGESVLSSKLENWVNQYKKDTAYWGVGSSPIFTVFHDLEGNVKQVLVNEDEIKRRSLVKEGEFKDQSEVNSKILFAKGLAREMEMKGNVIARNSLVAKFVVSGEESGFVSSIRSVVRPVLRPEVIPVLSGFGKLVFYSSVAIWAIIKLFRIGNKEERLTESEKEMMRRKLKSRKEKEILEKSTAEVVQQTVDPPMLSIEKPKLDKQELIKNISKAQASKNKLMSVNSSNYQTTKDMDLNGEIQEIRPMAKKARVIECKEQSMDIKGEEEKQPEKEDLPIGVQLIEGHAAEVLNFPSDTQNADTGERKDIGETRMSDDIERFREVLHEENRVVQASCNFGAECLERDGQVMLIKEVIPSSSNPDDESLVSKRGPVAKKARVIRSVKEAKEFLAKKGDKDIQESQVNALKVSTTSLGLKGDKVSDGKTSQRVGMNGKEFESFMIDRKSHSSPIMNASEASIPNEKKFVPTKNEDYNDFKEECDVHDPQKPSEFLNGSSREIREPVKMENWLEKNFHEVEPIVKKIGDGFTDNYKVAREKVNQHGSTLTDMTFLNHKDDSELDWMADESLREIVFQVRENELCGRDPFHMMDAEDKLKFFQGLEKKVEKVNEQLLQVHEYLHSNIENLDYGADGISVHDPPEKIIPRWKGPPLEKNPEFLNDFLDEWNAISARSTGSSYPMKQDKQKLTGNPVNEDAATSSADYSLKKNLHDKDPKHYKTVVEGSDGSIRPGKKSGKEYWQHTKKWSREFLESYNAETDPEVKSTMKDIGKDLDRWITEEEIQEAADLMTKLPARNKKFMEKKISKLKREMEMFGPQAVVSKYREYAEDKEDDYLWWLDLPHILCIELYTTENGEQKIGFYSLEMAADLELEPKPCHVIAFEDAGDCKNLCYIIQARMDMLGNGNAFIVPRPPKDVFREAKANGFSITVIRRRELQLNIDQTLEEVEEEIAEIGSRIYHDKLMQERSVDISSLMKGVFGQTNNSKSKRFKKPSTK